MKFKSRSRNAVDKVACGGQAKGECEVLERRPRQYRSWAATAIGVAVSTTLSRSAHDRLRSRELTADRDSVRITGSE